MNLLVTSMTALRRRRVHAVPVATVLLAALLLAACGTTPRVLDVTIDQGDVSGIVVGQTRTFTATVDATGGAARTVTWASSDATVATVDPTTGDVTATGSPGATAEITATSTADAAKSDAITIHVTVASVTIDQGDTTLDAGDATVLTATVDPPDAPQAVTWSSSDDAVATVDPDSGEVTATGNPGDTAEIAATSIDGVTSGTITLTVTAPVVTVDTVTIEGGDFTLGEGASATLTATVAVTGGASTDVEWSSDTPAVATVDAATGEVTATGTAGDTAQITATSVADATVSDTVTVTISATPATTITDLTATIALGSQVDLTWTADNATGFDVVCDDGAGGPELVLESGLAGTATGTTIDIPASDCQTLRVYALGDTADDDAETTLANVVLNGDDTGAGSLRSVIANAPAGATVGFASDVTEVVLQDLQFFESNDAHLVLDADVIISGPAGTPVTVRGDDTLPVDTEGIPVFKTRVFYVAPTATVQLDGLVVSGGAFIGSGGAVRNDGDLTITNATLENNRAWYRGGAVHNLGTLLIENSTLQNNEAAVTDAEFDAGFACIGDVDRTCGPADSNYVPLSEGGSGGALYNEGTAQIADTLIDGNSAIFSGGGIYVDAGTVDVTGATTVISNNTASDDAVTAFITYSYGGGVASFVDGGYTMTGGEISGNASANVGGGIANGSGVAPDLSMTLTDVTVTNNTAGEFGGGFIHYYGTDVPPAYSLEELGATAVTGNVAGAGVGGDDGDDRFYNDINASLLAPSDLTAPGAPSGTDRR